jgi:hypothetical protein
MESGYTRLAVIAQAAAAAVRGSGEDALVFD